MYGNIHYALALAGALAGGAAFADDIPPFDENGPFRPGEGFGTPASCETIGSWIDKVPDYHGRISMVITGQLVETHWDGALAYLIMCEPEDIQVMCVTYYPAEVDGKELLMAGGYNRHGEKQIILDPCLTYDTDNIGDTHQQRH